MHDGKIITLPDLEVRGNVVYERLINNEISDDITYDIRIPMFGEVIPFAIIKLRDKKIDLRM